MCNNQCVYFYVVYIMIYSIYIYIIVIKSTDFTRLSLQIIVTQSLLNLSQTEK